MEPVFIEGDVFIADPHDESSVIPAPAGWYVSIATAWGIAMPGFGGRDDLDVFQSAETDDEGEPLRYLVRLATGHAERERADALAAVLREVVQADELRKAEERETERRERLLDERPEARVIATGGTTRWYGGERRDTGDRARMRLRRRSLQLSTLELAQRVLAITGDRRSLNAQRMQLANFESGKTDTLPAHVLDAVALVLADAP
jgi:hypothetical protein